MDTDRSDDFIARTFEDINVTPQAIVDLTENFFKEGLKYLNEERGLELRPEQAQEILRSYIEQDNPSGVVLETLVTVTGFGITISGGYSIDDVVFASLLLILMLPRCVQLPDFNVLESFR